MVPHSKERAHFLQRTPHGLMYAGICRPGAALRGSHGKTREQRQPQQAACAARSGRTEFEDFLELLKRTW
jgi:hypothetical protein